MQGKLQINGYSYLVKLPTFKAPSNGYTSFNSKMIFWTIYNLLFEAHSFINVIIQSHGSTYIYIYIYISIVAYLTNVIGPGPGPVY